MLFSEVVPVAQAAPVAAPAPVATSTDYPCADGSVLGIDKLEVGGMVVKDGAPAADGEYTLANGTLITVTGGLISDVVAPAAATPEPLEPPVQMSKVEFESSVKELRNQFEKRLNAQNEAIEKLIELVEQLAEMPIEKPVDTTQQDWDKMSPLAKFRAQKQMFN